MPDNPAEFWATLKSALDSTKTVIDIWRSTKGAPEGKDREELEAALEVAFTSAEQATALLAQQLDFKLCKCTFPGTPMLFQKYDETTGNEIVKCPKCGAEYPPELKPLDTGLFESDVP